MFAERRRGEEIGDTKVSAHDGYIRFQTEAGALIRNGLAEREPSLTTLTKLREAGADRAATPTDP